METNINKIITPENHKIIKPPHDAYLFFPTDFDIVEVDKKNPEKIQRRIFEGKYDLLPYEKQKLENLYDEIEKHNSNKKNQNIQVIFANGWKECDTLRIHQATNYKAQNTINLLIEHFKWKASYFPLTLTNKTCEILNSGFIYIHGRDFQFRPLFIINAKFYIDNMDKYIYDDWLACIVYLMEYMINNLLIPGQVENWNIIFDCCGVSLLGLPKDMKRFASVLQSNYRCRLFVNFVYGMGTFMNFLWGMAKVFLDEITVKKVRMSKKGQFKEMLSLIHPEQLEKKYGGTAPDVTGNYFPPIMPSNKYVKEEKVLVSEQIYRENLKSKVVVPSPYFEYKIKEPSLSDTNVSKSDKNLIEIKSFEELIITPIKKESSPVQDEIENTNTHKGNLALNLGYFKSLSSKSINTIEFLKK
jgi:hypothetical protein